ncbi:MAG: peptidyl-prolyl cis-trans isomerase [Bacteroidota bacterium]
MINKIIWLLWCMVLVVPAHATAQEKTAAENYVARAGSVFISEEEFIQRFEFLPALSRNRKQQLEAAKLELLYAMVAEKLLAQEAVERKLDEDTLFNSALLSIRKLLARDQLYREQISGRVTIPPAEIVEELRRTRQLVHVDFLFFDEENDAQFVRSGISTGADFDRMSVDSSLTGFRDTATVIWSDADMAIEQAAYELKPGGISPVIVAGSGFYILRCVKITEASTYSHITAEALQEKVMARIRQRKEQSLVRQFIPSVLHGKTGYAKPEPFKLLARGLIEEYEKQAGEDSVTVISNEMTAVLRIKCQSLLFDTLVVAGETYWNTDEVITMLLDKQFTVRRGQEKGIPVQLNNEIRFWVEQELLCQEGLRQALDQRPEVKKKIDVWRSAYLADMMKLYARKHVTVSEGEVWEYLRLQDTTIAVPQVKVRELRTSSLDEMNAALADLASGVSLEDVVRSQSNDPEARKTGGETLFFSVTDRTPVGEIAAGMEEGERYGPLRVGDDVVYFELLEKRVAKMEQESSLVARKEKAATELLASKYQGTLNKFLAQVARNKGVDIYMERLQQIKVTSIPMLVFRLLGFGGRMFAVPFVDPQLQWLNIDPPDSPVLP